MIGAVSGTVVTETQVQYKEYGYHVREELCKKCSSTGLLNKGNRLSNLLLRHLCREKKDPLPRPTSPSLVSSVSTLQILSGRLPDSLFVGRSEQDHQLWTTQPNGKHSAQPQNGGFHRHLSGGVRARLRRRRAPPFGAPAVLRWWHHPPTWCLFFVIRFSRDGHDRQRQQARAAGAVPRGRPAKADRETVRGRGPQRG